MPVDDQVLMHPLASLIEGMWMSPQIEADLRLLKIDPDRYKEAIRQRIRQIANNDPMPS